MYWRACVAGLQIGSYKTRNLSFLNCNDVHSCRNMSTIPTIQVLLCVDCRHQMELFVCILPVIPFPKRSWAKDLEIVRRATLCYCDILPLMAIFHIYSRTLFLSWLLILVHARLPFCVARSPFCYCRSSVLYVAQIGFRAESRVVPRSFKLAHGSGLLSTSDSGHWFPSRRGKE